MNEISRGFQSPSIFWILYVTTRLGIMCADIRNDKY